MNIKLGSNEEEVREEKRKERFTENTQGTISFFAAQFPSSERFKKYSRNFFRVPFICASKYLRRPFYFPPPAKPGKRTRRDFPRNDSRGKRGKKERGKHDYCLSKAEEGTRSRIGRSVRGKSALAHINISFALNTTAECVRARSRLHPQIETTS